MDSGTNEVVRGFILQPTYRIVSGSPVVHLFGVLENGASFLVRDRRQRPYFYIGAGDAPRAQELGAGPLGPTGRLALEGGPVVRVEVARPADTPPLRRRLEREGIACHEADVRFAMRYLIDRGIRGSLAIAGDWRRGRGVDRIYDDPEVRAADWTPRLKVLAIDIETDPSARRLLSVALYGCGAAEVLLFTPHGSDCPSPAVPSPSERQLVRDFCRRVRELDPDVITGWNVVGFDLRVLERLARRMGERIELGRDGAPIRLAPGRGPRGSQRVTVTGRLVLDGIDLLRGAFVKMEDYSLDAVARQVLGEGKTLSGHDRADEILIAFRRDRQRFVEYNLTDARLVREILDRLQLVELAVERSRLTGMPPDRVSSSIAAFDFLYLSELTRANVVAPSVGGAVSGEVTGGGQVLTPRPGLYHNVLLFDFKSLYPSIIRTFQIDPLGLIRGDGEADPIVAPNGAAFRRRPGILTRLLDELFPRREAAERQGDRVASYAIKILMNSFYGVLGTPVCRFHSPALANAITSFGRSLLSWCRKRIESYGYAVIYGDTDSLFVESNLEQPGAARRLGEGMVARLNHDLGEHIRAQWRLESRLEIEFEALYLRLVLPPVRHGSGGARKRYAGLVEDSGARRVVFTGLEVVRRDWTDLARQVQRQLYERLFFDRPVAGYLHGVVDELRGGGLDELLVYRKALRKDPRRYTSTTPPHVVAARRQGRARPGDVVCYVMTTAGPEPAGDRRHPLDYKHYVEKQIRPVSEPVLEVLGLDFAAVIGDERQLTLFPRRR